MGSSKFTFPIPGRRSKTAPSPPTTTPRTKAQKILGTGEINDAQPTPGPPQSRWGWETRSNSGISIAISETTASHTGLGETGLGVVREGEVAGSRGQWEDESAIIPKMLSGQGNVNHGQGMHDTMTDASSLRRRQSSSTITSYYDKSKLPLSISQQTSNSAMAKGLPTKAQALLDIEGEYAEHGGKAKKKKPAMLDLSSLLPKPRSSRYLKPETYKGLVLGPDLVTKSPSLMSASPDATPPPISQRTDRSLRKKLTRESLKEVHPAPEPVHQSPAGSRSGIGSRSEVRHRPTKSTVDLLNLYDHYEQRSFADVLEDAMDTPGSGRQPQTYPAASSNGFLAPQSSNAMRIPIAAKHASVASSVPDLSLTAGTSPSSLISPPTDSASISSRHTRTSKASKRTDRSLTDFDLQQNSVLSLSSDSEDDGYEPSSKSSLAVPALSDGQVSPTSPRSAISQRSAVSVPQDTGRVKVPKRTSFASQPQFLPIPEGAVTSSLPRVNARTSSLSPRGAAVKLTSSSSPLLHQISRLSIGTTSTGRTASGGTIQGIRVGDGTVAARAGDSPPQQASWTAGVSRFDDFPSPPAHRGIRQSIATQSSEQPTPPLSPTSVDFYLQSQPGSRVAFDADSRSVSSARSLGSGAKGVLRSNSTASSQPDNNSGRFMAVTRQEEMLLAALRMKRARMREDIIAEFEETLDREEDEELQRQVTNGSSSGVSRQSSMSTMRTVDAGGIGALSARPQHQPQIRVSTSNTDMKKGAVREQILLMMDRPSDDTTEFDGAEPSPDLDGFLCFDDNMEFPVRRGSRGSSGGSGASTRSRKTSLSATGPGIRSRSHSKEGLQQRRDMDQSSFRSGSRRSSDKEMPMGIPEDPREAEEDAGVPRPDSPISPLDFPTPVAMTRKKQVRLSAVGNYKPNIEAGWWDDSG